MLGVPRTMISNNWKYVKASITLDFLHKLVKLHNLVRADHKQDLRLAILEYRIYQGKNSQCKQTHIKVKLHEGFPRSPRLQSCLLQPKSYVSLCSFVPRASLSNGDLNGQIFHVIKAWQQAVLSMMAVVPRTRIIDDYAKNGGPGEV